MHLTRKESNTKLPIERKGTKYIARASSHIDNSVSVVLAVRDMLKLAKTASEVRKMIKQKILKINGRVVKDYRESIQLFNLLEADKVYELSLLPTKKFTFVPVKTATKRLCKVINKTIIKKGIIQLNLHDGTNLNTTEKINVGESVYLDMNGKIKDHFPLKKGSEAFIISGKYAGTKAKVMEIVNKNIQVEVNGEIKNIFSNVLVAI